MTKLKDETRILVSSLLNFGSKTVEVDGRVFRPGPIPHKVGMTAREALLTVGGADRFGQIKRVHLYKNGKKVAQLNLSNGPDLLTRLEPGDRLEIEAKVPWEN